MMCLEAVLGRFSNKPFLFAATVSDGALHVWYGTQQCCEMLTFFAFEIVFSERLCWLES
jgi:hypothetical protein